MASASTQIAHIDTKGGSSQGPLGVFALPDLLSCLILSWSDHRAHLLQSVAEDEAWQAKVCDDVQDFLKSVFQLDLPLTIVDLPPRGVTSYSELRDIAARTCQVKRSLVVCCGNQDDRDEETWARQLGAWVYLPGVDNVEKLKMMFAEARKAVARQASAYVEANGYR